ncbi:MAG TPA: T9SS type A sorting domain-containing protein [Flavobacterium sp.]|nr:T9SS type A sorting domain-containing protein [Flavobacterium sp.]
MKILLQLLLFSVVSVHAQEPIMGFSGGPINGSPVDGYSNRFYDVVTSSTPLDETAAGADMIWNFNQLSTTATEAIINTVPTAEELAEYPGTYMVSNLELHGLNGSIISVTKEYSAVGANNTISLTGFEDPALTLQLNYVDNNMLIGSFPLDYTDSVTDLVAGTYVYDMYSGNFSGTTSSTADAYGILNTNAFGSTSDEVTRFKIISNLDFEYVPFGNVGTLNQVKYYYYRQGDLFPFFKSTTTTISIPLLGVNETTNDLRHGNPAFLGTEGHRINKLVTFSNPVGDNLTISNENLQISTIQIFDINGRLVINQKFDATNTDVSALNSGTYIVIFDTEHGMISKKMLKN